MSDLAKTLKEKNWNMLIIIILLIVVGALVPLSVSWAVDRSVRDNMSGVVSEAMQAQMTPVISALIEIGDRVEGLEENQKKEIMLSGIAAFGKFSDYSGDDLIEALDTYSQNRIRLQLALEDADTRDILMQSDKELCEFFIEYFDIE